MKTANITYTGELRCEATHLRSGTKIITDAPVDNHGKGEAFSPTDLVSTALVACMITVLDIAAPNYGWKLGKMRGDVQKIMSSEPPRRISKLVVELFFEGNELNDSQKDQIQRMVMTCPVKLSLHPDIELEVHYVWE